MKSIALVAALLALALNACGQKTTETVAPVVAPATAPEAASAPVAAPAADAEKK